MDDVVWTPDATRLATSQLVRYERWLAETGGRSFGSYEELWRWSTEDLEGFWRSVWDFFAVDASAPAERVLGSRAMPGAQWFPGARLSYARHMLRHRTAARPALVAVSEDGRSRELSWDELERTAGALRRTLAEAGVGRGDRVVAYMVNGPAAVAGLIACASLGAIWSTCAPDFAKAGAADRFAQLAPKAMLASDGYRFNGRAHDRRTEVAEIARALPSLELLVVERTLDPAGTLPDAEARVLDWEDAIAADAPVEFEEVPFEHPLWVLFSSGTTGKPKGIVHSHGGILLEHLKLNALHNDLSETDRVLIVTSTTWTLWNSLVGALLSGATAVLYDGSPMHPDPDAMWRVAAEVGVTTMGVGAAYLHACVKAGLRPRDVHDLSALRTLFSTGSPLSDAGFDWVRDAVGPEVWLSSTSGGTDVCTSFVAGVPTLPVRRGRITAPVLGVAAAAFDELGEPVVGRRGELVVTEPMPSMPVGFWNDPDGARYRESYFETFPGVWRHGDFIAFDEDLSSVIYGRSDATLNRRGVRIGTAEIYSAVEAIEQVREALVIGVELDQGGYYMPLFVAVDGDELDEALATEVRTRIMRSLSPRHVPDEILAVPAIPHTKTGKKLEVPIKRLYQGAALADVCDPAAVDDPAALETYERLARAWASSRSFVTP